MDENEHIMTMECTLLLNIPTSYGTYGAKNAIKSAQTERCGRSLCRFSGGNQPEIRIERMRVCEISIRSNISALPNDFVQVYSMRCDSVTLWPRVLCENKEVKRTASISKAESLANTMQHDKSFSVGDCRCQGCNWQPVICLRFLTVYDFWD